MGVKIGEVTSEITADVKKTEDMKVLLKVGIQTRVRKSHSSLPKT